MRVISKPNVIKSMAKHPQWRIGVQLWLDVFDDSSLMFESFQKLRDVWRNHSGWNVDRIPASKLVEQHKKGPLDVYVFDINKNEARIISWINTTHGTVFYCDLFSHAEYDKWCKINK